MRRVCSSRYRVSISMSSCPVVGVFERVFQLISCSRRCRNCFARWLLLRCQSWVWVWRNGRFFFEVLAAVGSAELSNNSCRFRGCGHTQGPHTVL